MNLNETVSPMSDARVVLASGSPRRHELLAKMGVPFTALVTDTDETADGYPQERVRVLAERKARAAAEQVDRGIVIGADTLVALQGESLGKPEDDADAKAMLKALSGKKHQVYTGVCLIDAASGRCETRVEGTDVYMRELSDKEIDQYIASGEPRGKAGAYAIQGLGGALVERYEGSYENIIGFPVALAADMLRRFGYPIDSCHAPEPETHGVQGK